MLVKNNQSYFEIDNIRKYQPFMVVYEDIGNDSIQVDISGLGVINYWSKINDELLLEINTNINNALTNYSKATSHNSELIGYHLELFPTKKFDRVHNAFLCDCKISIVFKKPVSNASAFSLYPTINLITSIILEEIFILND